MPISKIIVSSKVFRSFMREADSLSLKYDGATTITMGYASMTCHAQVKAAFECSITLDQAIRLGKILDQIKEQPITVAFDDNTMYLEHIAI